MLADHQVGNRGTYDEPQHVVVAAPGGKAAFVTRNRVCKGGTGLGAHHLDALDRAGRLRALTAQRSLCKVT